MHQKKCFLAKLVHIYDVEEMKKYLEKTTGVGGWKHPPHPIVIGLTIHVHCTVYSM